jgi:uncharacterized ubiquitin-like protein YukD
MIADANKITVSEVKLFCKGKVMKDHFILSDFKLTSDDILNLVLPEPV